MKKFAKMLIFALVVCFMFAATGCNLFPQDYGKYLSESVVTLNFKDKEGNVAETIEITREEYLTAYNNYGAQLIQQGNTEEDAKQKTISALINRKAIVRAAKSDSRISFTDKEKQELYFDAYEAMLNNAQDYEDAYKEEKDIDKMTDAEVESGTTYKKYEKQANLVLENGKYVIKKIDTFKYDASIKFDSIKAIRERFYAATKNDNSVYKQISYRRYLNALKETQRLKGTDYTNDELFDNEIQRIYNNLEENWYVEKYEEVYTDNKGYSPIDVDQVLAKYKSMITSDKFEYSANLEQFNTDMLSTSDFKKVDYFVNDNYFYVTHILIKLSDAQSAEIKELESKAKLGTISEEYLKSEKSRIFSQIMASERNENGIVEDDKNDYLSVNTLIKNLNADLKTARNSAAYDEDKNKAVAEVFRNYMYRFNEDDGIMNAEYPYVIGTNDSKMVESFTDASRKLYEKGEFGAISGLVESEYGVHIIMYLGKCENLFTVSDEGINLTNQDVIKLDQQLLNPLNNKTVFDKVYESLVKDNYSILLNMQTTSLTSKDVLDYTIHSDKI